MSETIQTIEGISSVFNIVLYILQTWGMFLIAKKLGEKYPWIAFIPVIQIYTILKCAQKTLWWILWLILAYVFFIGITAASFFFMFSHGFSVINLVAIIIAGLPILYLYINILHSISKRTGRGAWTTVGLFFVPFIMFPVVGYKLQSNTPSGNQEVASDSQEVL